MSERRGMLMGRPWLRAWLVAGLALWALLGVDLVTRANTQGLVEDISFSPYHLVGYAALLVLAIYVAWTFFRAFRHGRWRNAFPPLYGGLAVALVLLIGWVVIDPIWRETLGVREGIENGLAPPRLLIPIALVLLAIGPVREAIAERLEPGLRPGEIAIRWAGVVAVGVIGAALTLVAFNPAQLAIDDLAVLPGTDNSEIWTMRADGSDQSRLLVATGNGVDYSLPAWSPKGTRIAVTVWTNNGGRSQNLRNSDQTSAIWTVDPEGNDPRLVVDGAPDQAWTPAWSPDAVWIAYTLSETATREAANVGPQENAAPGQVGPPSTLTGSSIWIVPWDRSAPATRLTPSGVDAVSPAWSRFNEQIAYVASGTGLESEIHVATVSGGQLRDDIVIASNPANDWGPSWLPDGRALVFASNRSGNDDIWFATVDNVEEPIQLTNDAGGDWVPAVSPDGLHVAFVSDRSGDAEVWLMNIDGSEQRNLSRHPGGFDGTWSVGWSRDGDRLVYAAGAFQESSSGWIRGDFAAAQALIFGLMLAAVALLVVALGAPLGSFAVVMAIVVTAAAIPRDEWRFIPGAILAGLAVDLLVRSLPGRLRGRGAAAALPALANLALGLTIGLGGTLFWSVTLLLGVVVASGLLGWALAESVERLLLHRPGPEAVPAG